MTSMLQEFDPVFAALGDPSRRTVLEKLAIAGESTATKLAEDLPISRQAVVKHLARLYHARLVRSRRAGRETLYRVNPTPLAEAAQTLEALAQDWDRTLLSLKRIAEER